MGACVLISVCVYAHGAAQSGDVRVLNSPVTVRALMGSPLHEVLLAVGLAL